MTDQSPEERAAEAYSAEVFALNPDGFTVAPYVNQHTMTDAFLAGVAWARANPGPEVLELVAACQIWIDQVDHYGGDYLPGHRKMIGHALSQWRATQKPARHHRDDCGCSECRSGAYR